MIPLGLGLLWVGYSVASWGWVLGRGYNITYVQWVAPVNGFNWPAPGVDVPRVPKGHLWPTKQGTGAGVTAA